MLSLSLKNRKTLVLSIVFLFVLSSFLSSSNITPNAFAITSGGLTNRIPVSLKSPATSPSTATSATVSYTIPSDGTVKFYKNMSLVHEEEQSGGGTFEYTFSNLSPGDYTFEVNYIAADNTILFNSVSYTVTTSAPSLSAPTLSVSNLSGASGTATSASIKYTIDKYSIVYLYDNGEDYDEISNAQGSYSYTFNSLGVGTHILGAKACNASNLSLCSEVKTISYTVTNPTSTLTAPSGFYIGSDCQPAFSQTSKPYISISWTDNSSNETGFKIYRSETSTKPTTAYQAVAANNTRFSDTSVTPGQIYYYWITAYNSTGESSVVGPQSQYAPRDVHIQNLKASNITPNSITWTWEAVSGVSDYYLNLTSSDLVSSTETSATYTKNNLQPNTDYTLIVLPEYSSGSPKGCWSGKVTAKTLSGDNPTPAPDYTPISITEKDKTTTGISVVVVTKIPTAVFIDSSSAGKLTDKTTSTSHTLSWNNLKPGTTYTYHVHVGFRNNDLADGGIDSEYKSGDFSFTTLGSSLTYSWYSGAPLGTCTDGTQTVTVYCKSSAGTKVTDSYCANAGTKPATSQSCTATVYKPDLIIKDIQFLPKNPTQNQSFTGSISMVVKNQGNSATSYYEGVRTSITMKKPDGTLINMGGLPTDYLKYNNNLAAGAEATVSFPVVNLMIDTTYVVIVGDVDNALDGGSGFIAESNETNNTFTKTIAVEPATTTKPDLTVAGMMLSLSNPQVNQEVDITITYKNEGMAAVTENWNGRIDFGQAEGKFVFKNNAFPRTSGAYPSISDPLNPGESFGETYTGYFTAAGNIVLSVTIDAEGKIAELNETNNTFIKTITVGQATPPVIKDIQTSGLGATSVSLTWLANGQYNCVVNYSKNSDLSNGTSLLYTNKLASSETGYWYYWVNVSGLTPATKYYYKVLCTVSENSYVKSPIGNFTTAQSGTLEIINPQAVNTTATSTTIVFSTNQAAKGAVWYGTVDTVEGRSFRAYNGGSYEQYLQFAPSVDHEIHLTSLLPNTTYYYRASAVTNNDVSTESISFGFKTLSVSIPHYFWYATNDWSECIDGVQNRTVVCHKQEGTVESTVDNTLCAEHIILPKPADQQNCESSDVSDNKIGQRLAGRLLLAVEDRGRIYYIYPDDHKKYEVTFGNVMSLFQDLALGISNSDLNKILINPNAVSADKDSDGDGYNDKSEAAYGYNPYLASDPAHRGNDKVQVDTALSNRLIGKLLLQVEDHGRIWYVDQAAKRWEVTWENVMNLFTSLSLGITNADLAKIPSGN